MTSLEAAARPTPDAPPAGDALLPDLIARPATRGPTHPPARSPVVTGPLPRAAAGYRILRAWQRALDVAARAHRLAAALPAADAATLGADLRRAGAAVPAHIAAGNLAYDPGEHRRSLGAAQSALARVETLALLAEALALLTPTDVAALLADSADTLRLVRGLARVAGAAPLGATVAGAGVGTAAGGPAVVSEPAVRPPRAPAAPPARATRARRTARPTTTRPAAGPDAPPSPRDD